MALLALPITYLANNRPPNLAIPTPAFPANNAYNDFAAAAAVIKNIPHKAPASMVNPPKTRAGLLAASAASAKDAAPGLAILRRGFGKPCQAPVSRSFAGPQFTNMAAFREVERTLSGVRLYYELTNQPSRAVDAALDGEELAVMFPRGGALIASLVGVACEAISLAHVEPLLPKLSKVELAHAARRLDAIAAKRAPWSDIILEEGRASTSMMQQLLRDPKNRGFKANYDTARALLSQDDAKSPTMHEALDTLQLMLANKTAMLWESLHYYEMLSEEAKRPFASTSNVKVPDNPFLQMMAGVSNQGRSKYEAAGAILLLLRLEVALYRYRIDHGAFPAKLEQLAPAYVASVPPDPFSGASRRPLHYSLMTQTPGFLLYSVGSDTTDNGGRAGRYPDDRGFDIVAGWLGSRRKEY